MRINATAKFYSHETREWETVTQDFEGETHEDIAFDYFGIYGDALATLTVDGEVVWDDTAGAESVKQDWEEYA